jgi:serine/threonine protein kinase
MEHLKTLASFTGSTIDSGTVASESCLNDNDILAFVKGEIAISRADTIHSHLDSCVVCQQLLTEATHALDANPISEAERPSWNTVFQPGAVIAKRYRVRRLVARGGMGEVYEVFDTFLHERVALKTVSATHCDSAEAVRLLKAEVQLARRIGHPNVCRIFDLGSDVMAPPGGEIQFLVMEFVEGECLGKKLRQTGPLALDLALSVAHQLLLGLSAAHQAGILHRDFKSDNVMLRAESNARLAAVILDFGLAKILNESGDIVTTQHPQSHAMVGTIGYMAPEQMEGELLSAASDIYAFGVVWFEMLTGRLPFEEQTIAASVVARLHRSPEPPSHYNSKVPTWLDDIVMRCLSRHRETRFTSADAVLSALAAGPSVSAQPTQLLKRAWRHRLPIAAAAAGVLAGGMITLAIALAHNTPVGAVAGAEGPTHPQAPKAQIASDITPQVTHAGDGLTANAPLGRPEPTRAKQRKPDKVAGPLRKPFSEPEPPVTDEAAPTVEVTKPQPSASPPVSPSAALSSRKPDWLPLTNNKNSLEPQLQVE